MLSRPDNIFSSWSNSAQKRVKWKKIITETMYAKVLCLLMNICHFIRYSRFCVNEYAFRVLPLSRQFNFFVLFLFFHHIWNYSVNLHGSYSKTGSGNSGLWVFLFFMKLNTQSQRKYVYDECRNENFMNIFETLLRKFVRLYSII